MTTLDHAHVVDCRFDGCEVSMVTRVVMATVDQLSVDSAIDIGLLDALDHPLGESIEALHPHGIESVSVAVDGTDLAIDIRLARSTDPVDALAESADVVRSFFDIDISTEPPCVTLTGSLAWPAG